MYRILVCDAYSMLAMCKSVSWQFQIAIKELIDVHAEYVKIMFDVVGFMEMVLPWVNSSLFLFANVFRVLHVPLL